MKKSRTAVIVLILVGLLSVPAQAGVIPGRWEKVQTLPLGPQITVEVKNGDRTEGQLEGLSPSELSLRTGSAQAGIPRADIDRITTREADRLSNGGAMGAVVGVVLIWGLAFARLVSFSGGLSGTALIAVSGAGIGARVDALKKTEVVLYQTP